ncbi:uncharacterized protein E5676_scaffold316G00120 [Cucumis melo var. makuwa]|uniref:Uncharacterized protein n=1 Tax=Cucumis melo var. makuwa TaxID=1194695 RepID=A0A5D3BM69_CUCMM|nr:uncharacterized protein E5676_scaffold316G00120 [Cucumis melo var. makuwa]
MESTSVRVNVLLVKFLKDILVKKRKINDFKNVALTQATNNIFKNGVPKKMTDPGSFTIPYSIGILDLGRALCELRATMNLLPLSIFKKLKIGEVQPTHMRLQHTDLLEEAYYELFSTEEFLEEDEPDYKLEEVNTFFGKRKFEPLDLQTKDEKKIKPSIKEPLELELKPLPNHLKYAYLGENDTLPIIISAHLDAAKENALLKMLKLFGDSFKECLNNLEEVEFFSIWGFFQGMSKQLRRDLSYGIESGLPKIDVVSKLLPPSDVKPLRSFLGHAGFHRIFIQGFFQIAKPLRPFPQSGGNIYILVVVDYVSKWVETISYAKTNVVTVSKFLKGDIFTQFGTLRALIND